MATEPTIHEEEGDLSAAMDETIRSTLADIRSRDSGAEVAGAVAEETPAQVEESSVEQKARDEKTGQFVKGQQRRHTPAATPKASAAQAEPPAQQPKSATEPAAVEAPATPAEEPLKFGAVEVDLKRPPSSWKPGAKALWNTLPPDVQKEVYRRETDFSNSVLNGPMKQNADFGTAVRQVVEPYRTIIEAEGGTPERAIGDLLKTAALFRSSNQPAKLNAIFALDQQFNTGLRAHFENSVRNEVARLTGQQPTATQQPPQQFRDERVDSIMQSLQAQERQRASEAEALANNATDTFFTSKNDKGEPLYPFVDNVLGDMTDRVSALRRTNPAMPHHEILKQAYDAAVWANPETRAVLIAQTQAPQQQAAQVAQHAARARQATVGAMPKRGAIPATEPAKSFDDTIRETARELGMFT